MTPIHDALTLVTLMAEHPPGTLFEVKGGHDGQGVWLRCHEHMLAERGDTGLSRGVEGLLPGGVEVSVYEGFAEQCPWCAST